MTLRSPRLCCWTVQSVTVEHGLSHVQRAEQGLLLLYIEPEQESDCMCETQQHVLICGAVGSDGVMAEHHRQLLSAVTEEAVARSGDSVQGQHSGQHVRTVVRCTACRHLSSLQAAGPVQQDSTRMWLSRLIQRTRGIRSLRTAVCAVVSTFVWVKETLLESAQLR